MYKRILVPLDGSELAETVLACMRMLAQQSKAEIILLRVAEYSGQLYSICDQYPPADPAIAERLEQAKAAVRHEVERYLKCIAARPELAGLKVVVATRDGPVVEPIGLSAPSPTGCCTKRPCRFCCFGRQALRAWDGQKGRGAIMIARTQAEAETQSRRAADGGTSWPRRAKRRSAVDPHENPRKCALESVWPVICPSRFRA
jgi:hypothetical protein